MASGAKGLEATDATLKRAFMMHKQVLSARTERPPIRLMCPYFHLVHSVQSGHIDTVSVREPTFVMLTIYDLSEWEIWKLAMGHKPARFYHICVCQLQR